MVAMTVFELNNRIAERGFHLYFPKQHLGQFLLLYHLLVRSSFKKISQMLERWLYMPVLEAVKSKKWGTGSPTVAYIHRLSSPPGIL